VASRGIDRAIRVVVLLACPKIDGDERYGNSLLGEEHPQANSAAPGQDQLAV